MAFVPTKGIEPSLPCENQILSLARLPIPPHGPEFGNIWGAMIRSEIKSSKSSFYSQHFFFGKKKLRKAVHILFIKIILRSIANLLCIERASVIIKLNTIQNWVNTQDCSNLYPPSPRSPFFKCQPARFRE